MPSKGAQTTGYVVPTYKASPGQCWYHFLHGNVPGHQIDFIYRPEVPEGPITPQHFSHLSRLVRYIEPRSTSAYAFAIGNLSRDDTQYEPGRGGVALIFGLRIRGALDHAGRQDPPFCHAMAAVDRNLSEAILLEASLAFHRKLLPDEASEAEGSGWYRSYARHDQSSDARLPLLRSYVADFADLPAPGRSAMGLRWKAGETAAPKRVVIVHGDRDPFSAIAACAARIAGVLVASDIRWTAISTGRDIDIPGGISVRFVPEHDAREEPEALVLRREDVPEDPREIADQLFGAQPARPSQMPGPRKGWRQLYEDGAAASGEIKAIDLASVEADPASERARIVKPSRAPAIAMASFGIAIAIGGIMVAARRGTSSTQESIVSQRATTSTTATQPVEEPSAPTPPIAAEAPNTPAEAAAANEDARAVPGKSDTQAAPGKKPAKPGADAKRATGPIRKKAPSFFDVP